LAIEGPGNTAAEIAFPSAFTTFVIWSTTRLIASKRKLIYNGFYYEGPEWIGRSVQESVKTVDGRAKVYAGLMFPDIKNDFEKALDEAFDNGASGVSFFDGPSDEYLHQFKAYLDKKGLKTE
jgi:hypothetical protein